jgi:hypothetical protein
VTARAWPLVPCFKIAKPKAERMNTEHAPSALDDMLSRAGYLLLDFDGPICSLFAGTPTAPVADRLRGVLLRRGVALPADRARLAAAGAEAVISGMGDLASALRTRCGNLG